MRLCLFIFLLSYLFVIPINYRMIGVVQSMQWTWLRAFWSAVTLDRLTFYLRLCFMRQGSCGSAVVEHSPHHSKVKGSNPATVTGTGREKTG